MEQNWPTQYPYYQPDPNRPGDRIPSSPSQSSLPTDEFAHRRSLTQPQHSTFAPPPPPPHHAGTGHPNSGMNLPPFGQTFYSSSGYHSNHQGSPTGPGNLHVLSNTIGAYSSHVPLGPPGHTYTYPVSTPANITPLPPTTSNNASTSSSVPRQPPPHSYSQSPRMQTSTATYSSSPAVNNLRNLSPNSPTTHLHHPGQSSGSTSSSSFPSSTRAPAALPKQKRRSTSDEQSVESWEEGESGRYMKAGTGEDDTETDNQPWGMPQEEYKALNPKDKKQVRNRIGARRFRAKRKDYVATLETAVRGRDEEITSLRSQLEAQRLELNVLRERLGMPHLPGLLGNQQNSTGNGGGLGLMGANGASDWQGGFKKEGRDEQVDGIM